VNLGIGMPTLVPEHLPPGVKVWLQSENGILGMGPYPTKGQLDACEHFPEKYSAYVELVYPGTSSTQEKRPLPCYLERQCSVCGDAGLVSAGLLMPILADTSESFAMIRGGHIDVAILGVSSQPCKSGIHTY
jgi:3-oxoacid CoA-transferase